MQYHSTRNGALRVSPAEAVMEGLAPDGGLYVPEQIPDFDWQACLKRPTLGMSAGILSAMLPDLPDMEGLVRRAYTGKFDSEELTPTVPVGDFSVLELFRGPTAAFKDVALSVLPQLMAAAREMTGTEKELFILTATSGDTGKAALEGFRDVPGVKICVFYPDGGVSQVQRAQMVTQEGRNVRVCGIQGDFDDAQSGVKAIFSACRDLPVTLSSANSINIGRLVPQIVYYFRSYRALLEAGRIQMGEPVNFSVPTGNFGDILAGYLAKRLGLPVGRLVCAANANCVLTDFFRTGTYDRRRPLHRTISPSMDILVSSNLERMLYFLTGDTGLVADWMARLEDRGWYTVSQGVREAMDALFWSGYCDDARAGETIGRIYREQGYLCDPHTATGWAVAEDYVDQTGDRRPMVVLSTASPYKFPEAVLAAIGKPCPGDGFAQMEQLRAVTGVPVPANLVGLGEKPLRHTRVIPKGEMEHFVLSQIFRQGD